MFVKVALLSNGRKTRRKRSKTVKHTSDPAFDEELTFDLCKSAFALTSLELSMCCEGFLTNRNVIGKIVLSSQSQDNDVSALWADMLAERKGSRWLVLSK